MKPLLNNRLLLILFFSFLLALSACRKEEKIIAPTEDFSGEVANKWFDLARKITKETPGFTPPVAARAYAYTGVALYEAVVNGSDNYQSLAGQINGLSTAALTKPDLDAEYHWGLVANSCLADMLRKLYAPASAANMTRIDSLYAAIEQTLATGFDAEVVTISVDYGKTVAAQMYAYSTTDGQDKCYQNNFPASYVLPTGPGFWVPTPPAFLNAMQPYWGNVRPFVSTNITHTQPQTPIPFSTNVASPFYAQALEVYNTRQNLTPEQEKIAQFWSDDPGNTATPPGHSVAIATQALRKQNANLAVSAETYAKIGMGVHDAFVSCWRCKYQFNLLRPVTYIQQHIDPSFSPVLITPPFPEFTSGHSVQAAACATLLTNLFGNNFAFTDSTHVSRTDIDGSPRYYASFEAAAQEAAISRLYGGIHYREAIDKGIMQGKQIGENIAQLLQFKQ
ncbi:MAG TPA: vanadium-dependent haloperoxidase [Chitinophagales bacterium]|mgnify:CR=1 FL=1|nr:vanadium-dependent haloperoxidase [Chitinophagales bacterium]HRK25912.1 vanadium-dependent haloperoxidase [Chitinophagales bacterium]